MELQAYRGDVGSRAETHFPVWPGGRWSSAGLMVIRPEARWEQEGLTHISGHSECSWAKQEPAGSSPGDGCSVGEPPPAWWAVPGRFRKL